MTTLRQAVLGLSKHTPVLFRDDHEEGDFIAVSKGIQVGHSTNGNKFVRHPGRYWDFADLVAQEYNPDYLVKKIKGIVKGV